MSKINDILIYATLGLLLLLGVVYGINLVFGNTNGTNDVKPGQIWVQIHREKNPFEKETYDTIKVLKVKDGYAMIKFGSLDSTVVTTRFVQYKSKLLTPTKK